MGKGAEVAARSTSIASCISLLVVSMIGCPVVADVNLELRPPSQTATNGTIISIELFAVSDSGGNQPFLALETILLWDPCRLRLIGKIDNGPYAWASSAFPNDSGLDGLNAPFGGPTPFVPANDGDAFYQGLSAFPPAQPANATPAGLLITTLRFQVLADVGVTSVELLTEKGLFTETRVFDAFIPGTEITGQLGPPAVVSATVNPNPWAVGIGSRFLRFDPQATAPEFAILVTGDECVDEVECISAYVQPNGTLASAPFFQSESAWDAVKVKGPLIRPGVRYVSYIECSDGAELGCGDSSAAATYRWGDLNNSGVVDLDDILCLLEGFSGDYTSCLREAMDIMGCTPNGAVDLDDLIEVLSAFQGDGIPCPSVCP